MLCACSRLPLYYHTAAAAAAAVRFATMPKKTARAIELSLKWIRYTLSTLAFLPLHERTKARRCCHVASSPHAIGGFADRGKILGQHSGRLTFLIQKGYI